MSRPEAVNIAEKLSRIDDYWNPRIAAELNGQAVKLARLSGEFVWHHHENEDELFLVIRGTLRMCFRDREVTVRQGEFIVVPRGVEHKPVADDEVEIMLFEPLSTRNTGNVEGHELTRETLKRV
jgi:mannose-6-phosphate isomerase-like protein (cupin superfamily)